MILAAKRDDMTAQQTQIDYARVEQAIGYIAANLAQQPTLDEIAAAVHVSPFHFQRMFVKWAGVTPKQFMRYLTLHHAKKQLRQGASVLAAAHGAGLSGGGRLHDLFVTIEAVTPGVFKDAGAGLTIDYDFAETPFGQVMVASTAIGICHIAFDPSANSALATVKQKFPQANLRQSATPAHQQALGLFEKDWSSLKTVKLHLQASPFQIKVWEALLKIPLGMMVSYGDIAHHIGQPSAARAVGTAVATNPVAFLIPCHRVIQKQGALGGYMWGTARKQAMLGWEAVQTNDVA